LKPKERVEEVANLVKTATGKINANDEVAIAA
jgi:hypothetical protein